MLNEYFFNVLTFI